MPGIRKPTNVLELKGAYKKNPQRKSERANEPKDDRDVGKPPRGLSKEERAAWKELVDCAIPGVLTYADRPAVLAAAQLFARMKNQAGVHEKRRNDLVDTIKQSRLDLELETLLVSIVDFADRTSPWRPSDQANFTQLLARMGMTPADRSKIVLPKKDEGNPFDDD